MDETIGSDTGMTRYIEGVHCKADHLVAHTVNMMFDVIYGEDVMCFLAPKDTPISVGDTIRYKESLWRVRKITEEISNMAVACDYSSPDYITIAKGAILE